MKPSNVDWSFGGLTRTQAYEPMQRAASTGPRFFSAFIGTSG